jgi:hypothetical protein
MARGKKHKEGRDMDSGLGAPDSELPDYNDALGNFLKFPRDALKPLTQTYNDVLMQVYPLQADITALQSFCEKYFRLEENPPIKIRPVAPWVFMLACNYGKMALKTANIGWVSQNELAFSFPVAVYEGDRFKLWAMVHPFIYVDNPLSMSLGRQVYGWPKAGIEIVTARPDLAPDLRCLATVDLRSGPLRHEVGDSKDARFLEVFQRQPFLSGRAGGASYFTYLARLSADYVSLMSTGFEMLGTAAYDWTKNPPRNPIGLVSQYSLMTTQYFAWYDYVDKFLKSISKMARARLAAFQNPFGALADMADAQLGEIKCVTLKQFRDAEIPTKSCYQAIVVSTLGYGQPTDGGFLMSDPLSPDISGGVLIKLYDDETDEEQGGSAARRIVDSLGLTRSRVGSPLSDGLRRIHTLQPVIPFWARLDLTYGSGDLQWLRTKYTHWTLVDDPDKGKKQALHRAETTTPRPYCQEGSGAAQELRGPLKAANFGLRIFGIKAKKQTLQELCDRYLGGGKDSAGKLAQSFLEFKVQDPPDEFLTLKDSDGKRLFTSEFTPVLMLVSSFDGLSSGPGRHADKKNLHDRVLTFAVPAKCTRNRQGVESLVPHSVDVLIPLYVFVEQDWDFLTEHEVYGRLAFKSELESPPNNWIDDSRDQSPVLSVSTMIFPHEEEKAQSARVMPLIELRRSNWDRKQESKRDQGHEDAAAGVRDDSISSGYMKLMGIHHHLTLGLDVNTVTVALKQFRDAVRSDSASYQELVSVKRSFGRPGDPAKEPELKVFFYSYSSFDIAKTMGLVEEGPKTTDVKLNNKVHRRYELQTIQGATVFGQLTDEDSQCLCWSVSKGQWNPNNTAIDKLYG